jgi:hypothetical protein
LGNRLIRQRGQVAAHGMRMGMIRPKSGCEDGQGALEVGPCPGQVAHVILQRAQVVEALGGLRVVGAERFFFDGKGVLVVWPRPRQVAHGDLGSA